MVNWLNVCLGYQVTRKSGCEYQESGYQEYSELVGSE